MLPLTFNELFGQIKYQILATALANVVCLAQGSAAGWLSPALPILQSVHTPLASGPLTQAEVVWIGALFPLGALFGTLFFGILANYVGSRLSLIFCGFPITASWITVIFAQSAWHIILARLLSGLTNGGVIICISLFIAEIAEDYIRGFLSSLLIVCHASGIMLGFVGGAFLNYEVQLYALISIPILFLGTFMFLPDSPQQLLRNNKTNEAEQALRFYRNCDRHCSWNREDSVKAEFEKFKAIAEQNKLSRKVNISDFFTREARRGIMICSVLLAVNQFSGTFTLNSYASTIFKRSGSTINPNYSTVIMGCVQVAGAIVSMSLIDRIGRKILLLISTLGSSISLIITGAFSYYNQQGYDLSDFSWLPIVTLSLFIFVSSLGIIPVPFVLLSETLPHNIRRIGATICTCSTSLFGFIMLHSFPMMLQRIELHGCMWFFSLMAFLGFVFTIIAVRETKGKNLDKLNENS